MNTVVQVEHLTKTFSGAGGRVRAVEDVNLEIKAGELLVVQGPSGCGKTTLLLAMGGLLEPDGGRVCINGREVLALKAEARARFRSNNIGFVFQQFHLVPYLSARENVLTAALGRACPSASERAQELLSRFGLEQRARHLPAELSTGERQRTALARALLNRPPVLLADEPTGNLDQENAQKVWECLQSYADEGGAVLLVTHETALEQRRAQLVRMEHGRLA